MLGEMRIDRPTYLDLGAHHPTRFSNTYLFYIRGCRGVCVEADPALAKRIGRRRPRDESLNVAVAASDGSVDFHVMDAGTLSTASSASLASLTAIGRTRARTIRVQSLSPTTILTRYFRTTPNLVSLDVEGMDVEILQAWDFAAHRPEVFIVETVDYAEDGSEKKLDEIPQLMHSLGYFTYGDTFINTVFVDHEAYVSGRRGELPPHRRQGVL